MKRNLTPQLVALLFVAGIGPAFAEAGPFATLQDSNLWLMTDWLTTNGVPGLTNSPGNLMVSSVGSHSLCGGQVTLVSTQAWVKRYNGPAYYPDYANKVVVDPTRNVVVGGDSMGLDLKYAALTIEYGGDGTPLWTNTFHATGANDLMVRQLAVDAAGNVYVGCDSESSPVSDVVTIKYAADGLPLWTNRFNTGPTNRNAVMGLAVDAAGNVCVLVGPIGTGPASCFVTLKYDPSGMALWTNYYKNSTNGSDFPVAIALDTAGNVFVAGSSDSVSSGLDYATLKYAPDGRCLWTNRYSSAALNRIVEAMTVDGAGEVIVSGDEMSATSHLYATIMYANDGTPLWTNLLTGPAYQGGNVPLVATDLKGDVYITGGSPGANGHDADFTITRLTKDGVPVGTNRFFEFNTGNPAPAAVALDSAGNFYLAGSWNGEGGTNDDYVVVKWAPDGTALWTNRYDGPASSDDWAFDLAVDSAGHVYPTGGSKGPGTGFDWATIKYCDYVSYTPPPDFFGSDSFVFTVTDSLGRCATGMVAVVVSPGHLAFDPTSAKFQPESGGFGFQVLGATTTDPIVIYASSNLADWQPLLTNQPVAGAASFFDPTAGSAPKRFYRAVQQP